MKAERPEPTLNEVDAQEEALLDAVEAWHKSDGECSLQEWLGVTDEEYAKFVAWAIGEITGKSSCSPPS